MTRGDPQAELSAEERARLAQGFHEELAEALAARGRPDLAGWVREQIWDFEGAFTAYRVAGHGIDALRCALESGKAAHLDEVLGDMEARADPDVLDAAIALLEDRRRPMDAARLMALRDDRPDARADALLRAGDRIGAAGVLAEAGRTHEALEVIAPQGEMPASSNACALAARLAWNLGDAEGAARYAQAALRRGREDPETLNLLARALGSLGHDLAAQMVLGGRREEHGDAGVPGRYHVTGLRPSGLAGAAYVGIDRLTLQEVEIHLLLADIPETGPVDPEILTAIDRFATVAEAAAAIGHPAIRPVLRVESHAGLLVLPRAEGPSLRSLIRPPGMLSTLSRVRGLMAFIAEGLAAAHARGLIHGWMLPSQIVCDAVGRPMLGPFGAHHLAGLTATHTGGLEEIVAVTAPELRGGAAPTVHSDLYAVGALLAALLTGSLDPSVQGTPDPADPKELVLTRALLDPDPQARPSIQEVLDALRTPVADVRDLGAGASGEYPQRGPGREGGARALQRGIEVSASETWSDEQLDALCSATNPWLQPILDRDERRLILAPWPEGSRALDESTTQQWRRLLAPEALQFDDRQLKEAVLFRIRPSSLVATPSGEWMIALDDLITR